MVLVFFRIRQDNLPAARNGQLPNLSIPGVNFTAGNFTTDRLRLYGKLTGPSVFLWALVH